MFRRAAYGAILALMLTTVAFAQARPVWEIGRFDDASHEFGAPVPAPRAFNVSVDQPQDWVVSVFQV